VRWLSDLVLKPLSQPNQAFLQSFPAARRRYFQGHHCTRFQSANLSGGISFRCAQQVGVLDQFSDFSAFFTELYTHFTGEPWLVYPDVRPALEHWQQLGIVGVLSFDSRVYWY